MDTRKVVATRIQQLCAEHGQNINSLSRRAAVPPSTTKSILNGDSRNPGVVTIKLLCDGLGISLYDFFNAPEFQTTELEDME